MKLNLILFGAVTLAVVGCAANFDGEANIGQSSAAQLTPDERAFVGKFEIGSYPYVPSAAPMPMTLTFSAGYDPLGYEALRFEIVGNGVRDVGTATVDATRIRLTADETERFPITWILVARDADSFTARFHSGRKNEAAFTWMRTPH